ncbi:MAG: hypothetical protein ACI8WW_001696, partial [Oceanospirillaceae bacterium]
LLRASIFILSKNIHKTKLLIALVSRKINRKEVLCLCTHGKFHLQCKRGGRKLGVGLSIAD